MLEASYTGDRIYKRLVTPGIGSQEASYKGNRMYKRIVTRGAESTRG